MTEASVLSSCASIRRNINARLLLSIRSFAKKSSLASAALIDVLVTMGEGSCGAAPCEPAASESPAAPVEPPAPVVPEAEKVVRFDQGSFAPFLGATPGRLLLLGLLGIENAEEVSITVEGRRLIITPPYKNPVEELRSRLPEAPDGDATDAAVNAATRQVRGETVCKLKASRGGRRS